MEHLASKKRFADIRPGSPRCVNHTRDPSAAPTALSACWLVLPGLESGSSIPYRPRGGDETFTFWKKEAQVNAVLRAQALTAGQTLYFSLMLTLSFTK